MNEQALVALRTYEHYIKNIQALQDLVSRCFTKSRTENDLDAAEDMLRYAEESLRVLGKVEALIEGPYLATALLPREMLRAQHQSMRTGLETTIAVTRNTVETAKLGEDAVNNSDAVSETLLRLQSEENEGKGVQVVRDIVKELRKGDREEAILLTKQNWEEIEKYPMISTYLALQSFVAK